MAALDFESHWDRDARLDRDLEREPTSYLRPAPELNSRGTLRASLELFNFPATLEALGRTWQRTDRSVRDFVGGETVAEYTHRGRDGLLLQLWATADGRVRS